MAGAKNRKKMKLDTAWYRTVLLSVTTNYMQVVHTNRIDNTCLFLEAMQMKMRQRGMLRVEMGGREGVAEDRCLFPFCV